MPQSLPKQVAASGPSAHAAIIALSREHAAIHGRLNEILGALGDGESADDDPEYQGLLVAAEALCKSAVVAFPAAEWDAIKAKAATLLREYHDISTGAQLLAETRRGPGDLVAAILDDLFRIVRAA